MMREGERASLRARDRDDAHEDFAKQEEEADAPQAAAAAGDAEKAMWQARQGEQALYRRRACEWLVLRNANANAILLREAIGPVAMVMDAYLGQAGAQWI